MLHSEFIPAAKDSRRLMVMLHGLGDSLEGYRWFPEALKLPWLNFLLVNAPDPYFGGYSWFDYPDDMTPGILRSRKLLFALLDDLRAKGFPPEQTTLGGFSQGCLMTMDVGLRYPHKFAGLVGLSGWIAELEEILRSPAPLPREQRMLMTHGPFDNIIPFAAVQKQAQTLQAAGFKLEWHEFPKGHTIHGEEELAVIRRFVNAGYPVVGG